jgi:hypothetical protein
MTNPHFSHTQSAIERIVMRRVYRVRVLRGVFSGVTLGCVFLALALYGLGQEVWVAHVFENAPASLNGALYFWTYAFEHTRLTVQGLTLLTLASLIYLARATARNLVSLLTPARV